MLKKPILTGPEILRGTQAKGKFMQVKTYLLEACGHD